MIVVKIELHSAIDKSVTVLGKMLIINTGHGTKDKGDYSVHVANKRDVNNDTEIYLHPARTGKVLQYPRLSYNVWRLISRAIRSAFPEEK